jgi:hypothetical protein
MTDDLDGSVPLAEAAQRLGIREELVRQRIYRGKLKGHKVDGVFFPISNVPGAFAVRDCTVNVGPRSGKTRLSRTLP